MKAILYKGISIERRGGDVEGEPVEAVAESTGKQVFKASGTHGSVFGLFGGKSELAMCVEAVKREIDEGFEACEQEDCEICEDYTDD